MPAKAISAIAAIIPRFINILLKLLFSIYSFLVPDYIPALMYPAPMHLSLVYLPNKLAVDRMIALPFVVALYMLDYNTAFADIATMCSFFSSTVVIRRFVVYSYLYSLYIVNKREKIYK